MACRQGNAVGPPNASSSRFAWVYVLVLTTTIGLLFIGVALALIGSGPWGWSLGIAALSYDVVLVLRLTFLAHQAIRTQSNPPPSRSDDPSLTVVIAARNEALVIVDTLMTLQQSPGTLDIIVVDDGSTDGMLETIAGTWPLRWRGELAYCSTWPALRVLRRSAAGKAAALNAALTHITTDLVATLDADTRAEPQAWAAFRSAFASRADLVAACGVLEPTVPQRRGPSAWEGFQRLEYLRSFLWRAGWARVESLVLVSGAFAAFRRRQLIELGGFDEHCLVEDYEVLYRLHADAVSRVQHPAATAVIAQARATTVVPARVAAFAGQRRRWFAGFIQVLHRYRRLVGDQDAGQLGRRHLVVKTIDMALPLLGIGAWFLLPLIWWRHGAVPNLVWQCILAKMMFDAVVGAWCWKLYRRWQGRASLPFAQALPLLVAESVVFQPLRQACACLGWWDVLRGRVSWGRRRGE